MGACVETLVYSMIVLLLSICVEPGGSKSMAILFSFNYGAFSFLSLLNFRFFVSLFEILKKPVSIIVLWHGLRTFCAGPGSSSALSASGPFRELQFLESKIFSEGRFRQCQRRSLQVNVHRIIVKFFLVLRISI